MTNVNINKLKGKIVEKGMTVSTLADAIGVDKGTLYRKMRNNGETMLLRDANAIIKALSLSCDEAISIFLSQVVA